MHHAEPQRSAYLRTGYDIAPSKKVWRPGVAAGSDVCRVANGLQVPTAMERIERITDVGSG